MHNFKELKVWRSSIEHCKEIFKLTRSFPADERCGLTSQITRAVVSIPSNIAEGCGRESGKELYRFLSIALGLAFELETQLILAKEFNYIPNEKLNQLSIQITEVQKMPYGLQKSLDT